ncbi:MAG TPA: class I SAM-dependent methyltransferase [Acidimicrobiales bacterium]|nr:class I SAM-dependent methyltransferase [Acidimicrobiales bacterium]
MTDTTVSPETEIDDNRAEEFAERLVGVLNDGSLALLLSVGHKLGLFDCLAELPPSTSQEIAEKAGLQERYVREWLGAMTTGRVVEYDAETSTYRLPAEHAVCLTRSAGPNNLARVAQFIPLMASVEGPVVECFRAGGGVPYSEYGEFHRLMAEDSSATHDAALVDVILPLVPGLPPRLRDGIDVADVGCGSGHAVNLMAQAFPESRFVGYDFSEEGIAAGKREAAVLGLPNARFEVLDVTYLDERERFDLVTAFDAIHDQARPRRVLANIARALRDDGVFLMVDVRASSKLEENLEHPMGPFVYALSTMHCMTVSLSLDGEGLGTVWGEQKARQLLGEAGFRSVEVARVEADFFNDYFVARKGG